MFFTLSKVLWAVFNPGNLLVLALLVAAFMSFGRRRNAALWVFRVAAVAMAFITVVPIGSTLCQHLENRFPADPNLPADIAGIVILGGAVAPAVSGGRSKLMYGSAIERLTVGAELAQRFPSSKVVFSGGSGSLFNPEAREAHIVQPIFSQLGIEAGRIIYEDRARNTAENAQFAKAAAKPAAGENWVLVTSASHMPRAVGVFRKAGWPVIPYPVDYEVGTKELPSLMLDFVGGLSTLKAALHEFAGLTAYWVTGRTDQWYPAPKD
jgi:uncharacterized SAM-binding protein YcdF (DUF218 family)